MVGASDRKKTVPGTRVLPDGTYEVRRVVPPDCIDKIGKKTLTRRLNTSRYAEAAKWAPPILREFEGQIEAARAGASSPANAVDPRKAMNAIQRWRMDELRRAEVRAFNEPDEEIPDPDTNRAEYRKFRVRYFELRDGLSSRKRWEDVPGFNGRLLSVLRDQGITIDIEHPAISRLRPVFQDAWNDVVRYEDGLRSGALVPGELPPMTTPSVTAPATSGPEEPDGPTILETFEHWKREHIRAGGARKSIGEFETQVRRFVDFHGNKRVSQVTKKDIIAFKDAMLNYPARCPAELASKPFSRIVEWGEEHEEVTKLSAKTINEKVLASLRAIFNCAVARADIDLNPVQGIRVKSSGQESRPRLPYSADELTSLFASPVFVEKYRPRGGAGDAAKWMPLLALFTGARLEEIAIIEVADIKNEAGIDYIHFKTHNDDGTPRRVKNRFVRRKVPIHTKLIGLGFLKFVAGQRKRGSARLFPEVRSKREKQSAAYSQWYGRYARKYVPDGRKSFHSFRHTFKRALRDGRVEKTLRDAIMAHSHKDEAERYGIDEDGQGFSIEPLREAVETVNFPSITFDQIR